MDILQLDQELRSNKIRSCYFLAGEERHLLLTAKKNILKAPPDMYSAARDSLGKILDAYKTPSMFSPHRYVVVEEADHFKKKDWETVSAALKNPPPNATILFVSEGKAPAMMEKNPSVGVVECKKLYPRQVAGWLNVEARNLGLALSREAAGFLVDCVGTDLGTLSQTLEKLSLYVGARKIIQLEDVEIVAAQTAQKSVFDLANAIGEKNPLQATKVLEGILDGGEEPLKVLALISRHCRLLASAQEILSQSRGEIGPDFSKQLGVHPFFAKDYAMQAKRWSAKKWKKCFEAMFACDAALKGSRHQPQAVLEKLIWELCR